MYEELKERVFEANLQLPLHGLVTLTWGNASEIDREKGIFGIKPSGVEYKKMRPSDIVLLDLEGRTVEGKYRPSSDTPTHLELYRNLREIGGIVHTHSKYATVFAQARQGIPCYGATHADSFLGTIPLTRDLTREEVNKNYEIATGKVILECLNKNGLKPQQMPGVLVASHGPFTWGANSAKAVENAVILENVAEMVLLTQNLDKNPASLNPFLLEKHFYRKHGSKAYYGQNSNS